MNADVGYGILLISLSYAVNPSQIRNFYRSAPYLANNELFILKIIDLNVFVIMDDGLKQKLAEVGVQYIHYTAEYRAHPEPEILRFCK
jgi:hypothetical protein